MNLRCKADLPHGVEHRGQADVRLAALELIVTFFATKRRKTS
jgi:hypothetical protein